MIAVSLFTGNLLMSIRNHRPRDAATGRRSPVAVDRPVSRLLRIAEGVGHSLARWNERRNAEAELASMSDRMLADIGMARCEVTRAVRRGRGE
ncbi:DUF1127 domain-containing protein [Pararoseomonas sp. SCSIO 73927]|uniref:DUF1127 domain-containing protein n=1 Tax=Pararoseomonas sp. SCSIO 73927 TaxID=3114537 RepID=UPI0030CBBAB1